jgi:hypothetical protein
MFEFLIPYTSVYAKQLIIIAHGAYFFLYVVILSILFPLSHLLFDLGANI